MFHPNSNTGLRKNMKLQRRPERPETLNDIILVTLNHRP